MCADAKINEKLKKVSVGVGAMPPGGGRTYQVSKKERVNMNKKNTILYLHLNVCAESMLK